MGKAPAARRRSPMDRTRESVDRALRRRAALTPATAALLLAACTANVAAPGPGSGKAGTGGTLGPITGTGGTAGGNPVGLGGFNVSDGGPRPEGGPTEDANCGLQNFALDRRPAIVVLLQDRSTSMRNTINSVTRWAL